MLHLLILQLDKVPQLGVLRKSVPVCLYPDMKHFVTCASGSTTKLWKGGTPISYHRNLQPNNKFIGHARRNMLCVDGVGLDSVPRKRKVGAAGGGSTLAAMASSCNHSCKHQT